MIGMRMFAEEKEHLMSWNIFHHLANKVETVWACMSVSASGTGPVVFLIMWLHKEVAGWILMCTRLFIQIQWIEGYNENG